MIGGRASGWCWLLLWTFLIPDQGALAEAATGGGRTAFEVWMPAVAALVGGLISGILGPFLKEVVIQCWNERRSDEKVRYQIEQSYFAPLSASAEKLIWRLSEVLIDQRQHFLMLKTKPKEYNEYKRISTLYRVAALLGWIRAMNLELSALPRGGFGAASPVLIALNKVQSAMADGQGVEERRMRSFCATCGIDLTALSKDEFIPLAASFEVAMYALVGDELHENHRHLVDSTALRQEFICRQLLQFLADKRLTCSRNGPVLPSMFANLAACLGYREALIYREWQDAIGDAVIVTDEYSSARRYRIIGFEEFDRLIVSGSVTGIKPLREFIEDVDFENHDPADYRSKHLLDLARGVAALLVAISDSSHGVLVNPEALTRAKLVLALPV